MPVCKYCHSRISKFDKDICPVCGATNPLSGVTSDTMEITHEIDVSDPEFKKQAPRTKKKAFLLFALIGWTGAGFKYLRKKPLIWLLYLLINLVVLGGGITGLALLAKLGWLIASLITVGVVYVVNIAIGLYYLTKNNTKDGDGELIL